MTFQIESGVVPVYSKRGRKPTEFPLIQMGVGDSFLIPVEDTSNKKAVESWRRKVLIAKKRFNETYEGKFQTYVVEEGLRVWRTE